MVVEGYPSEYAAEMLCGLPNKNLIRIAGKEFMQDQEKNLESWRFIMNSCTKAELEDPEIIGAERVERIAKGSGRSMADVRNMLKQYRQAKKLFKMFKGGGGRKMKNMMKKFGGKLPDDLSMLQNMGKM